MPGPDLLLEAIVVPLKVATTTWEPESNHKLIKFQIKVAYVRNMYEEFVSSKFEYNDLKLILVGTMLMCLLQLA
jgi:hypothetical protein